MKELAEILGKLLSWFFIASVSAVVIVLLVLHPLLFLVFLAGLCCIMVLGSTWDRSSEKY